MKRFWEKVDLTPGHGPNGDCWVWNAGRFPTGNGAFVVNGRTELAHRTAWSLTNGLVPAGLHVLHRCDNRACVRPDHLWLGTQDDNMKDKVAKGRQAKGESNGAAVVSDKVVAEARSLYAEGGISQRELGRRFGVDRTTVGTWVRQERRAP